MEAKLLSLQIVRDIAASLVVLQHLMDLELKYANTQLTVIVHFGDLGVDVPHTPAKPT